MAPRLVLRRLPMLSISAACLKSEPVCLIWLIFWLCGCLKSLNQFNADSAQKGEYVFLLGVADMVQCNAEGEGGYVSQE